MKITSKDIEDYLIRTKNDPAISMSSETTLDAMKSEIGREFITATGRDYGKAAVSFIFAGMAMMLDILKEKERIEELERLVK